MGSKIVAVVVLLLLTAALIGGGALLVAGSGGSTDAATQQDTGVTVHDAWTAPNSGVTAVYLTMANGGEDDRVVGVSTDRARTVSLMGGGVAGVTHAAEGVEPVAIAVPTGTTELHPGAGHLMLQDVTTPLQPGDRFTLRLDFERNGPVDVEVEVVTWDEAAERSQ